MKLPKSCFHSSKGVQGSVSKTELDSKIKSKLSPTSRGLTRAPASHQAKLCFPSLVLSRSSSTHRRTHTRHAYINNDTRALVDIRARAVTRAKARTCTRRQECKGTRTHWSTGAQTGVRGHTQHACTNPKVLPLPGFPPCPSSQFPPRRGPCSCAPPPLAERPLTWRRWRARAPRAPPPGGPGSGRAADGRPGHSRRGPGRGEEGRSRRGPSRAAMPGRYAPGPLCLGVPVRTPGKPRNSGRHQVHGSSGAGMPRTKAQTNERTAPGALHLTRISAPFPAPDRSPEKRKKVSQPNPGKVARKRPQDRGGGLTLHRPLQRPWPSH